MATRTMNDISMTQAQVNMVKMCAQDHNINGTRRVDFLFYVDMIAEVIFNGDNRQEGRNIAIAAKRFIQEGN